MPSSRLAAASLALLPLLAPQGAPPKAVGPRDYPVVLKFNADHSFTVTHADSGKTLEEEPISVSTSENLTFAIDHPERAWVIEVWTALDDYREKVKGGKHPVFQTGPLEQRLPVTGSLGHGVGVEAVLQAPNKPDQTLALAGQRDQVRADWGRTVMVVGQAPGKTPQQANDLIPLAPKPEAHRRGLPTRTMPSVNQIWYRMTIHVAK